MAPYRDRPTFYVEHYNSGSMDIRLGSVKEE